MIQTRLLHKRNADTISVMTLLNVIARSALSRKCLLSTAMLATSFLDPKAMRYCARLSYVILQWPLSQYIRAVIQRRACCYNLPHLEIDDINSAENGILLSKTLHSQFSRGAVAFLKVCCPVGYNLVIFRVWYLDTKFCIESWWHSKGRKWTNAIQSYHAKVFGASYWLRSKSGTTLGHYFHRYTSTQGWQCATTSLTLCMVLRPTNAGEMGRKWDA